MNPHEATNSNTEIDCRRWTQKPSTVIDILRKNVTSDYDREDTRNAGSPQKAFAPHALMLHVCVGANTVDFRFLT